MNVRRKAGIEAFSVAIKLRLANPCYREDRLKPGCDLVTLWPGGDVRTPMTHGLAILCYHRIFDDRDSFGAWPYFERGTAVSVDNFRAQVAELGRFADIVSEESGLDILAERHMLTRPAVWLTFDDGYVDVLRALPSVATGTVFVTARAAERALPADAWYALLLGATRSRGTTDLGLGLFDYDLSRREGRARLVNGPERRAYLRASTEVQATVLSGLAETLGAGTESPSVYLNDAGLSDLLAAGWSVGSHGATHLPFDALDADEMVREARSSRDALIARGAVVRSIALPDGAHPSRPSSLHACGYECVLGLGDMPAESGAPVQPRYLVPNDPRWVGQVLRPALGHLRQ